MLYNSFILSSSKAGIKSLTSYSLGLHLLTPPVFSFIDICGFSSYSSTIPDRTCTTSPTEKLSYNLFTRSLLSPPQYFILISPVLSVAIKSNHVPLLYDLGGFFIFTAKKSLTTSPSLRFSMNCSLLRFPVSVSIKVCSSFFLS